ncbi:MAG: AAA family ATPase [Dehalococcoidia bacterium]|nr:AAA family ATPase [Dehalococcoidia bacterium]
MEHIGEILKKQTQTNTSRANTDTLSNAEKSEEASPASACPICKGAGFVHPLLPSGKTDYSRVVACHCTQKELDKEHQSRLRKYSGLEARLLKNMTLDSFDREGHNPLPEQRENLKEAFRLAFEFSKSPEGWLVFAGVNGCGKTHLAAAIANHRLKEGKPVKFVVVPDLLDHLRSTFSPQSPVTYDQVFEEVENAPLLILDDLGKQSTTPWAEEKLYQIINHRYNHQLPTVFTTNCSLDEINSPISSRFADPKISVVWNINAPDYRTDATKNRKRASRKKKPS